MDSNLKTQLKALDEKLYQPMWELDERLIAKEKRVKWLLYAARKRVIYACVVFIVIVFSLTVVTAIYDAATNPFGSRGMYIYLAESAQDFLSSGWLVMIVCCSAPALLHSYFAKTIRDYALIHHDLGRSIRGTLGRTRDGVLISSACTAVIAIVLYGAVSIMFFKSGLSAWWHMGIAGWFSGAMIDDSLERVADAANVAKSGTIARTGTSLYDGQRRYI